METTDHETLEPRERILKCAIELFSRKGFAATGVRELAKEADVNVAMISYYFGNKRGLLTAIFDEFFDKVFHAVHESILEVEDPEEGIRRYLRTAVAMFRANPQLARVAVLELPYDMPELAEHKASKLLELIPTIGSKVVPLVQSMTERPVKLEIVGPAMMAIIFLHFAMRPVLLKLFPDRFDEDFYASYGDDIADLILFGVIGRRPDQSPSNV